MAKEKIIILGGGAGGLSAGGMLSRTKKYDVTVIEKESVVGGLCATFKHEDYLLDYGPHKFYSVIPGIQDEVKTLMGEEFFKQKKKNSIYLLNSYLNYPLSMVELALKMGLKNILEVVLSMLFGKRYDKNNIRTYEEYIVNKFGRKLYSLVFEPLASKTWGEPSTLSADIARTRIPSKGFIELLLRVAGLKKEDETTDAKFFLYPRDGFGRITERMAQEITKNGGSIMTSCAVKNILAEPGKITGVKIEKNGTVETLPCDILISSIPLLSFAGLLSSCGAYNKEQSQLLANKLQSRTVFLVYLFVENARLTDDHWIFFPGREVVFSRVFEQKNLSAKMTPDNKTVLCCDFTDYNDGVMTKYDDAKLAELCIQGLEKVKILNGQKIEGHLVRRFSAFYPRYGVDYKDNLLNLFGYFKSYQNLLLTGRVGFYNYNNLDHCIDMGKFIAENISENKKTPEIFDTLFKRVEEYRIVD